MRRALRGLPSVLCGLLLRVCEEERVTGVKLLELVPKLLVALLKALRVSERSLQILSDLQELVAEELFRMRWRRRGPLD